MWNTQGSTMKLTGDKGDAAIWKVVKANHFNPGAKSYECQLRLTTKTADQGLFLSVAENSGSGTNSFLYSTEDKHSLWSMLPPKGDISEVGSFYLKANHTSDVASWCYLSSKNKDNVTIEGAVDKD